MARPGFDPVAYINEPRWHTMTLGLERIHELLHGLGDPQKRLRFVHVAGTNGKGSTCAYLAQVLQQAGYKVGLFTSPYVVTFEERIRIDGENISSDDLSRVTWEVREVAETMDEHPTEFELMTAVAFQHFAQQGCDIVVAEVGLGGRLDSTNVIENVEVSVIAALALDHTAILGSTIEEIAAEKAGIIKPGVPVVTWPQEPAALAVIEKVACDQQTTLRVMELGALEVGVVEGLVRQFSYRGECFQTQLLGSYQPSNAALALEAIAVLRAAGWDIPDAAVREGIAQTKWLGRFTVVAQDPCFIVDGGHNPQGAQALAASLEDVFPDRKAVLLVSVLADKDHRTMLSRVLPKACAVVATTPPNPRALSAEELAKEVAQMAPGLPTYVAETPARAVACARDVAGKEGLVVAFGSLYSLGDVLAAL